MTSPGPGGAREGGALEALAAAFVVPQGSGVYLTKNELLLLARVSEASLRVSERRRMLSDVLKSPLSLEELQKLVGRLKDFCRMHLEEYEASAAAHPRSRPLLEPWRARAQATVGRLEAIEEEIELARGRAPPPP